MTTNELRKKFLDFFASKGHTIVASDSLVPKEDPTVLFTTAGMQQFKKQFLGEIDGFTKATTSQKCLRTDDLNEVGVTAFHHTFFEMLGNFSFGDYFKKEAIAWAWEFLTEVAKLPKEKLWVSVYHEDKEAKEIWLSNIKIDPKKLVELGDKSNFWPSQAKTKGPNGPCGPCSEIFYDYGADVGCKSPKCDPGCSCGRFSEIWNLVFTQFNRQDGGVLSPLPNKNIDTGMGLERLAAVAQGKKTNFEIDLFMPILAAIDTDAKKAKVVLTAKERNIIADHMRAIVFSIADGVIPSNEGRGYVVKRLITDIADIMLEKSDTSFVSKLVPSVVEAMREPYPELTDKQRNISIWIQKTEEAYKKVRQERIPELKKEAKASPKNLGAIIFKYRDTFGLTLSAVNKVLKDLKITNDKIEHALKEAEALMDKQREKSRAASKMTGDVFTSSGLDLRGVAKTAFVGYDHVESKAKVVALFKDGNSVKKASTGETAQIILDKTPFYAESGGQVGDTGIIKNDKTATEITQTYKISDVIIHKGEIKKGPIAVGDKVEAVVDREKRLDIMRNHTATHLLQSALREALGTHVHQQGSFVSSDRLRFDFTHPKSLSLKEAEQIENIVNAHIRDCHSVNKKNMTLAEAQKEGALAFFAEKYGQNVRVVTVGEVSKELCGGTHLDNIGQIGIFKIVGESAIAQGIRRIEAVTGRHALAFVRTTEHQVAQIADILKVSQTEIIPKLEAQTKKIKELERELSQLKIESLQNSMDDLINKAKNINGVTYIASEFPGSDIETLRRIVDRIKQKARSALIAVGACGDNGTALIISVSDDLVKKNIAANAFIAKVSTKINASGGGRAQLAQAGCKEKINLTMVFEYIETLIKENSL